MPELPEVESIRRCLQSRIPGSRVCALTVRRADVFRNLRSAGLTRRSPRLRRAALLHQTICEIHRHGKQLAIEAVGGPTLVVHLGMSGQLGMVTGRAGTAPSDHDHVQWKLIAAGATDCIRLTYRDPRRFGGLWVYDSMEQVRTERWRRLGPDALQIPTGVLRARLRGQRCVKAALLDQRVIAGVGNIYADEALFAARIHPLRPAGSLTRHEVGRLAASIRQILRAALEAGGTTIRDFVDGDGHPGAYRPKLMVYGRTGQPCGECGVELQQVLLAQRTTVYCRHCQRPAS